MKYKISTLDEAYDDLKKIKKYLSQFYPGTVKKFVDLYKKRRDALRGFPFAHPVYEYNTKYRKLVVGDYLVFYIVREDTETVEVHRVLHGSRDIGRHLS
jgi:addiction module RelE/StbE family toxin